MLFLLWILKHAGGCSELVLEVVLERANDVQSAFFVLNVK